MFLSFLQNLCNENKLKPVITESTSPSLLVLSTICPLHRPTAGSVRDHAVDVVEHMISQRR